MENTTHIRGISNVSIVVVCSNIVVWYKRTRKQLQCSTMMLLDANKATWRALSTVYTLMDGLNHKNDDNGL